MQVLCSFFNTNRGDNRCYRPFPNLVKDDDILIIFSEFSFRP